MSIVPDHTTPTVETSITYDPATHQYIARAHGFVIDREWTQYQADIALEAWLTVYEEMRAVKLPRALHGVAAIADAIARLTRGASIVWHITSLSECTPTRGTESAAIITEGTTVELWALSVDGRLATLEAVFVDVPADAIPSRVACFSPMPEYPHAAPASSGASANPGRLAGALASRQVVA